MRPLQVPLGLACPTCSVLQGRDSFSPEELLVEGGPYTVVHLSRRASASEPGWEHQCVLPSTEALLWFTTHEASQCVTDVTPLEG